MAKSTTTKAKTKTTKKTPAKAAVKSAKTTASKAKKPAAKKSAAKNTKPTAAKADVSKNAVSTKSSFFSRPLVLLAGLYVLLAVAAGYFVNSVSAQVFLGHLAKDELASRAGTVLVPAATAVYEVEFRWLLVVLFGVSAVIALLRATRYRAAEEAGIKNRVQPMRWVEFAITGALAFEIVALLNGLQDLVALKLSLISIAFAALLAWMFERENAASRKPAKALYIAAAVAVILPVAALLVSMYGTYVYGMERSPWYAYAAAIVVSVGLLVTVRSVWNDFKKRGATYSYAVIDRNYNRISVVTKLALAVVVVVGLYAK